MKRYLLLLAIALGGFVLIFLGLNSILWSSNGHKLIKPEKEATAQKTSNVMIKLSPPVLKGTISVEESLQMRRSIRNYKNRALTMEQVSQMLWAAYGVSDSTRYSGRKLRTAPSAGATYPLEVYLMAGNVQGLDPGLYKYHPNDHKLSVHFLGDVRSEVAKASLGQRMLEQAPASIIYNAVYDRITSRYGNRGADRYLCMDLGHSAQNVYLQATAIGLATCAIGAFNDEELTRIIKPKNDEQVLYLMPIGYPNE